MSDQKKNSQAQPDSGAAQNKQPVQERAGGGPAITKGTLKTAKRLLGYVTKTYKVQFVVVLFCIGQFNCIDLSVPVTEVSAG